MGKEEKQILNKLISMEKKVDYIMEYIETIKLTNEEKKGKLLSKKQVFG